MAGSPKVLLMLDLDGWKRSTQDIQSTCFLVDIYLCEKCSTWISYALHAMES